MEITIHKRPDCPYSSCREGMPCSSCKVAAFHAAYPGESASGIAVWEPYSAHTTMGFAVIEGTNRRRAEAAGAMC